MKTTVLILVLACTVCGFVAWRVYAMKSQTPDHFGELKDQSFSYTGDCLSTVGSAEQLAIAPGVSPRSTLTVLVLGDESTANEPQLLGTYLIPRTLQVIDGAHSNARHQQEMLIDIWRKCGVVRRISISPIFLGVKESIAHLRAMGCKETSHCGLHVSSDLEENVEPAIKELLATGNTKRTLPAPLDNRGIDVLFCGFAATTGLIVDASGRQIRKAAPRDPNHEDRIQQTWRSVFTNPQGVRFEPYCPKPSNPNLFVSARESTGGEQ